ncbi:MAG: hypothetical protein HKO65_10645 [Gemmatimonadetes bacterium]|nr:hypothetical protein [Gemmatimonadota bacterium]NNM05551.1 hypothetical protein [Gemmatimonadota bacterium]
MRTKVGMVLLTVIIVVQVVFLAEKRRVRNLEPTRLAPGTSVKNIQLSVHDIQEPTADFERLWDAVSDRCTIMIFFDSDCTFCRQVAEEWRGVREVKYEGLTVPVKWTSVWANDLGAAQFVEQYGLPSPWYSMRGREDRMAFGITEWPKLYLLAPEGVFEGELARDVPPDGTAPPDRCRPS